MVILHLPLRDIRGLWHKALCFYRNRFAWSWLMPGPATPSSNVSSYSDLISNCAAVAPFAPGHIITQMSAARPYAPVPCSIACVLCTVCATDSETWSVIWIIFLQKHLVLSTSFSCFISLVGLFFQILAYSCRFVALSKLKCCTACIV